MRGRFSLKIVKIKAKRHQFVNRNSFFEVELQTWSKYDLDMIFDNLRPSHVARDIEAGDLLENFFVWALVSFIVIRVFLIITKYPQIQTENLHLAHMLLGGFLMTMALIISFIFLNKESKFVASVIGGIGFGAFIDELGKFITKNNDYHYEPAIALIYVILVIIFLTSRLVEKYFKYTPEEYAVNAVEMVKQALVHDLEKDERASALRYLKKADKKNTLVKNLKSTLSEVSIIPNKNPGFIHKIKAELRIIYLRFIQNKLFNHFLIIFFIAYSTNNFIQAFFNFKKIDSFYDWGHIISTIISGVFVLAGTYALVNFTRKKAYRYFRFAVLTHIFLTQFFLFVEKQFSAIFLLAFSVVIWNTLQYLISEERLMDKRISSY